MDEMKNSKYFLKILNCTLLAYCAGITIVEQMTLVVKYVSIKNSSHSPSFVVVGMEKASLKTSNFFDIYFSIGNTFKTCWR